MPTPSEILTTRRANKLRDARRRVDAEITWLRHQIRECFENANPVEALTIGDLKKLKEHAMRWAQEQADRAIATPAAIAWDRMLMLTRAAEVLQEMEDECARRGSRSG